MADSLKMIEPVVTERDKKALRKAKKREMELKGNGYRWIPVGKVSKLFVECDEDGKPTAKGQASIDKYKQYLGIND